MLELEKPAFNAEAFWASAGLGRRIVKLRGQQTFFSQGEAADSVFYLQSGRAKLTVVSKNGKEATITLLSAGEFVGEESLASAGAPHTQFTPDKRWAFADGLGVKPRTSEERSSYPNCALNRDLPDIVVDGALEGLHVDRLLPSTEPGADEKENTGSYCVSRRNALFQL